MFSLPQLNELEQAYVKKYPQIQEILDSLAQAGSTSIFTYQYEEQFKKILHQWSMIDASLEGRSLFYFKTLNYAFQKDNVPYLKKAMEYFNPLDSRHMEWGWELFLSHSQMNKNTSFVNFFTTHTIGGQGDYYHQFCYKTYKKTLKERIFANLKHNPVAQNTLAHLFQHDRHIYSIKDLPFILGLKSNQFYNFSWMQRVINKKHFAIPANEFTYDVIQSAFRGAGQESKNIPFVQKLFSFYQGKLDYVRIYDMIQSCDETSIEVIRASGLDIKLLKFKLDAALETKTIKRKIKI